jgi:hypothetical protein
MVAEYELERVQKEGVMPYFEIISRICLKELKKSTEASFETVDFWADV